MDKTLPDEPTSRMIKYLSARAYTRRAIRHNYVTGTHSLHCVLALS